PRLAEDLVVPHPDSAHTSLHHPVSAQISLLTDDYAERQAPPDPETCSSVGALCSPTRRLGGELRAAHAHAPARVLPQLLARVQMAERARHGTEVIGAEALRNVG